MTKVITMGEMLIDFVPRVKGVSLEDNDSFLRRPGGAPANVAVGTARLGAETVFLGKVGNDAFGNFLIATLEDCGVNTEYILQTTEANTCLAFVILDESGDRDFVFYRDPSADLFYRPEEIPEELFAEAEIFHFGSLSLTDEPVRSATIRCAELAAEEGMLVSYDPNYRAPLWPDEEEALKWMEAGMELARLVKLSEEELELFTGEADPEAGSDLLFEKYRGLELAFVTLGPDGCYYRGPNGEGHVHGFEVDIEDTTGAGDAFTGAVLAALVGKDIYDPTEIDEKMLQKLVIRGNAAGALTACGRGAISSLPTWKEIRKLTSWR
ncbi:MAG: carbohydrate kinase family protein [Halanaerobiaceae bacterium]